jgi:hypothetical protein
MASTVTLDSTDAGGRGSGGDTFIRRGTVNLGVYATNGVAVSKTQLELAVVVEDLDVRPAAGYVFVWDKSAGKVVAYWGDNNNASDGPGVEVPNATDLTAVVARFRAEGK